jgi:glycogen operon protein
VSYARKHNQANGEDNRDGTNENYSANYGHEGPTDDPTIEAVRKRQIKNFLLTLFISRGMPMLLGGDEFRRTQRGNNNAYCQDNESSWYDWTLLEKHREIHRFARGMIAFRRTHPILRRESFYTQADIRWFSPRRTQPNWLDPREKRLACMILGQAEPDLYLMFNASTQATAFTLPTPLNGGRWHLAMDTFQLTPHDLFEDGEEIVLKNQEVFEVGPRSSVILVGESPR